MMQKRILDISMEWYAGLLIGTLGLIFMIPFAYLPWMTVLVHGHAVPIHLILFGGLGFVSLMMVALWNVFYGTLRGPFVWNGFIFLGCVFLSALVAPEARGASLKIFFGIACRLVLPAIGAYSVSRIGGQETELRRWLVIWAALVSVGALYEVVSGRYFLFERQFVNTQNIDIVTIDEHYAMGTIGHPLTFSALMCMILPLALQEWRTRKRAIYLLMILVIVLGIVFAFRRSGWVLGMGGLVAWSLLNRQRFRLGRSLLVLGLAWGVCLAVALIVPTSRGHLIRRFGVATAVEEVRVGTRHQNLLAAWRMFVDHPLHGVGIGQFSRFQPRYFSGSTEAHATDNQYARMLAEGGIPTLVSLLVWLGTALWPLSGRIRDPYWGAAAVALVVFLINILLTDLLLWPATQMAFGVLLGATAGGIEFKNGERYS